MRIYLKQIVETGSQSREELYRRLAFWANRYGFERSKDEGDAFVYTRGSHWHALYTFDIRKVPTVVTVAMVHGNDGMCVCNLTCGSWLLMSTPGDGQRLSEQMDLLEACLKGLLSAQAESAAPERDPMCTDIQSLRD